MPNLEQHAVAAWITEVRPGPAGSEWPPAIRALEVGPEMPEQLQALGTAFDHAAQRDLEALAKSLRNPPLRDDLGAVMAQLGAARVLRILHWLSEADMPECHDIIAGLLKGDDRAAQALRATVAAVTRRATLARIFAPDRIAALAAACHVTIQEAA